MLLALHVVQLILYIALLAMVGQGVLYVIAGQRRERNVFYGVLKLMSAPFVGITRRLAMRRLSEAQIAWTTFACLALAYALVTAGKIHVCWAVNMVGCR